MRIITVKNNFSSNIPMLYIYVILKAINNQLIFLVELIIILVNSKQSVQFANSCL